MRIRLSNYNTRISILSSSVWTYTATPTGYLLNSCYVMNLSTQSYRACSACFSIYRAFHSLKTLFSEAQNPMVVRWIPPGDGHSKTVDLTLILYASQFCTTDKARTTRIILRLAAGVKCSLKFTPFFLKKHQFVLIHRPIDLVLDDPNPLCFKNFLSSWSTKSKVWLSGHSLDSIPDLHLRSTIVSSTKTDGSQQGLIQLELC